MSQNVVSPSTREASRQAPLRISAPRPYGPAAVVSRRAADRLREGHLWVYRSDLAELVPAPGAETIAAGALLTVVDSRAIPLGTALYSDASEIALRLISQEAALGRPAYLAEVGIRIAAALTRRRSLVPNAFGPDATTNALRLIFSEADNLPGIVVDRYHELVIVQLLTQGTAQDDVRAVLVESLRAGLPELELTIVERPDGRVRELEHLPAAPAEPLLGPPGAPLETIFTLNGLRFHFDATSGQKTGAFLDQRLNYAAAARHAHGAALDVCTYQGGFALHLAQGCASVTGVDSSRAALRIADRNLELNPMLSAKVDWIEADVFDLLPELQTSGSRYDTVVLDPPAFAKSRRAAEGALRGYKELNLRALKMLRPGGTLVTCSCSHHVALPEFLEVLRASAIDARRQVQVLETRGAAPDHPSILTLPETNYLKCIVLRVQ